MSDEKDSGPKDKDPTSLLTEGGERSPEQRSLALEGRVVELEELLETAKARAGENNLLYLQTQSEVEQLEGDYVSLKRELDVYVQLTGHPDIVPWLVGQVDHHQGRSEKLSERLLREQRVSGTRGAENYRLLERVKVITAHKDATIKTNNTLRNYTIWSKAKIKDLGETIGALQTYANKYFLLKFFNIPNDEIDPDKFEKTIEAAVPTDNKYISSDQMYEITKMLVELSVEKYNDLLRTLKIKDFNKIPAEHYEKTVDYIKKYINNNLEKKEK